MQSESGIVPDFDVGEEFQEEPKTYYELKSQPLKNRSVLHSYLVLLVLGWDSGCTVPEVSWECVRVARVLLQICGAAGPLLFSPCWHHYATAGCCLVNINFNYKHVEQHTDLPLWGEAWWPPPWTSVGLHLPPPPVALQEVTVASLTIRVFLCSVHLRWCQEGQLWARVVEKVHRIMTSWDF